MKYLMLTLTFSLISNLAYSAESVYLRASETKMSPANCISLGTQVSIVAFTGDNNVTFQTLNVLKERPYEVLNKTRLQIHEQIKKYCEDKKSARTFADFREVFHSACYDTCSKNIEEQYKDSLLGESKEKKNVRMACESTCSKANNNLGFLERGASLSIEESDSKAINSSAGDCSGAVATGGRNKAKDVGRDEASSIPTKTKTTGK